MSVATINRGPITDRVITELNTAGLPVGDNTVPTGTFGWQGEPNASGSTFIPWMSVAGGVAQPGTGSMGQSASEWKLPYTVTYAGVTRKQLDWLADKIRTKLTAITRAAVTTDSGNWKIQQIRCITVGATVRIGAPNPDYFTQSDLYEVWLSKENS